MLLKMESDFEVIGEANDGPEMSELTETRSFDVLIFSLTNIDDLAILQSENFRRIHLKSVVIYYDGNANYVDEMLRSGAKAYISSEYAPTELATAVRQVISGKVYLSSPLFERAVENYIKKEPGIFNSPIELLTKREFEIFNLVAKGLTSVRIGKLLAISRRTVEIHRANMLRKLNLASQYKQIKKYAIELGINVNFENGDLD